MFAMMKGLIDRCKKLLPKWDSFFTGLFLCMAMTALVYNISPTWVAFVAGYGFTLISDVAHFAVVRKRSVRGFVWCMVGALLPVVVFV